MSLEDDVKANTAAVNKLNANLEKYGPAMVKLVGGKAAKADDEGDTGDGDTGSSHTEADVQAAAAKLVQKIGKPDTQKLIKKIGGGDLAALKAAPKKWAAFMEAAEAALSKPEKKDDDELDL